MKNLKIYFTAIFASVICFSCLVDDEVENTTQNEDLSRIVGFQSTISLGNFEQLSGGTFDFAVPVHLLGGNDGTPSDTEITVTYEVGDINELNYSPSELASIFGLSKAQRISLEDGTAVLSDYVDEAIQGTQFNFEDNSQVTTIPANSTFDLINMDVYNDALDPGKISYFVLNLKTVTSSGDVVIGEQLKSTVVKFQLCRTDLTGSYSYGSRTVTVSELSPGLYRASYMPQFAATYTFDFTACAGKLVIVGWQFNENNSSTALYYVTQGEAGTVSPNGNITFTSVSMTDISWYSNLSYTFIKN
ncbi:hypothetical protein SAMN04487989_10826 [Bizionia echini]|uniref:DUF1735 domain-containing protein n=1 Tax=Bizionia echini TaxID=649333 RepID=A0A1I5DGY3_9FLAO|nr:hypothetical protein [Bizionia echini]SFN98519.1 hypothetical protein SAMN04487989_10826 [Bizionia echini]